VTIHLLDLTEFEAGGWMSVMRRPNDIGLRPPEITGAASRTWELRSDGADYLAQATGGHSLRLKRAAELDRDTRTRHLQERTTAFLKEGFDRVFSRTNGYYLIGYRPPQTSFQGSDSKFHSIKVNVRRRGVTVRSRNGYIGRPDDFVPTAPQTREEALQAALRSPFNGYDMRVRMTPFSSATGKDPKNGRRRPTIRPMLAIDARDLRFEEQPDGTRAVAVDIVAAAYSRELQPAATSSSTCTMRVPAKELADLESRNLLCSSEITLERPGVYMVRVAAMDRASGKIGSAYALASVPDFNADRLVPSTLELAALIAERVESAIRYERVDSSVTFDTASVPLAAETQPEQAAAPPRLIPMAGNPMERVFAPGTTIVYSCYLFGAGLDRATRKPKLEAELYMYGDPRRQTGFNFETPPMPVRVEGATQPVFIRGRIRLPDDLPPGDYGVALRLVDRSSLLDPKSDRQVGYADMDFTVARPSAPDPTQ
jgi:hypothetical protein